MSTWNDQTVQPSSTDENNGYIPIRVSGTTSLGQVSVTSLEAGIVATDAAVVGAETTRAEGAENALRNTINNEINRATNTETIIENAGFNFGTTQKIDILNTMTLPASVMGNWADIQGVGGYTITLPAISNTTNESSILFQNLANTACTIVATGSDLISNNTQGTVSSFSINPSDTVILVRNPNAWYMLLHDTSVSNSNAISAETTRATNSETNIAATHADTTLSNVNMAGISSGQLQALSDSMQTHGTNAGISFKDGGIAIPTSVTITSGFMGHWAEVQGSSPITVTFPAASTMTLGQACVIVNANANPCTITNTADGGLLDTNSIFQTNITLNTGDSILIVNNNNAWYVLIHDRGFSNSAAITNEITRATNTETNIAATHADTTLSNVNMAGISSAQLQALWTAIVGANPSLTNLIAE